MKHRIFGGVFLVLALLVLLTPWFIFPVCGTGRYAPSPGEPVGHHACQGTRDAESAAALAGVVVASALLLWPGRKALLLASGAFLVIGLLVLFFPLVAPGLCQMATMPCRLGTLPALVMEGVLLIAAAGAGLYVARKAPGPS